MALGWLKALQIASTLYSHRDKVRPLLDRVQRRERAADEVDPALVELTTAVRQLASEAAAMKKALRVVLVISVAALVASLAALGVLVSHVV